MTIIVDDVNVDDVVKRTIRSLSGSFRGRFVAGAKSQKLVASSSNKFAIFNAPATHRLFPENPQTSLTKDLFTSPPKATAQ